MAVPAAQHRAAGAGWSSPGAPFRTILCVLALEVNGRSPQILKRNESIASKAGDPPSSAILVVYVDKAEELPVSHPSTRRALRCFSVPVVKLSNSFKKKNTCLPVLKAAALAPRPFVPCGGLLYPLSFHKFNLSYTNWCAEKIAIFMTFYAGFDFLSEWCGMWLANSSLCCCYGSITHCYSH